MSSVERSTTLRMSLSWRVHYWRFNYSQNQLETLTNETCIIQPLVVLLGCYSHGLQVSIPWSYRPTCPTTSSPSLGSVGLWQQNLPIIRIWPLWGHAFWGWVCCQWVLILNGGGLPTFTRFSHNRIQQLNPRSLGVCRNEILQLPWCNIRIQFELV